MPLLENKTYVECDYCQKLREQENSFYLRLDKFSILEFDTPKPVTAFSKPKDEKRKPRLYENTGVLWFCNRTCLTEWLKAELGK